MRSRMNHTVSDREVHDRAAKILQDALGFVDQGYKCTVGLLWMILFFAAARTASIFDACQRLGLASDQTIRNFLSAQLPAMAKLEKRLNRALASQLPRRLFGRRRRMALDLTPICYYGKPGQNADELRRGKRKQGTSHFHTYATLCIVSAGERYTVAMTYVWKSDSRVAVVRRLLEQAEKLGLRPRCLLLDREFYAVEVVKHLKSVRCPFIMPVVHRGRRPRKPLSRLKGTRRFLAWKNSGFSEHVMDNRKEKIPVKICVVYKNKRRGKAAGKSNKPRHLVFAFWGFTPGSAKEVAKIYRTRYGIESSYRQMNQARIRTCTRNVQVRLLFVGMALVLRNLWVWLHQMVLSRAGRVRLELLRLRTMLLMLQHFAEAFSAQPGIDATPVRD